MKKCFVGLVLFLGLVSNLSAQTQKDADDAKAQTGKDYIASLLEVSVLNERILAMEERFNDYAKKLEALNGIMDDEDWSEAMMAMGASQTAISSGKSYRDESFGFRLWGGLNEITAENYYKESDWANTISFYSAASMQYTNSNCSVSAGHSALNDEELNDVYWILDKYK